MDELSDTKIRNATPRGKNTRLPTAKASASWFRPNGTKLWLYRYRFGGKRKNMSFGTFPGVGLKAARSKRYDAEKLLDQGQDPVTVREAKRKEDEKLKHTFRAVGEEWATTKLEKRTRPRRRSSGNAGILLSSILRSAIDRYARLLRRNC